MFGGSAASLAQSAASLACTCRLGSLSITHFSFLVYLLPFDTITSTASLASSVFNTDRSSDEGDCYQGMLEVGHLDFDLLATSSSEDDKIATDDLAVIHDYLACACRVEGQRARGRERV